MIDIWDINTYTDDIRSYLNENADIVRRYWEDEIRIANIVRPEEDTIEELVFHLPPNEFQAPYHNVVDGLDRILREKTFRTFHYTRLTEAEVQIIGEHGVKPNNQEFLEHRLVGLVDDSLLSEELATNVLGSSEFKLATMPVLLGGFSVTSMPMPINHDHVSSHLRFWGGHTCYYYWKWAETELAKGKRNKVHPEMVDVVREIIPILESIGRGRIFEISASYHWSSSTGFGGITSRIFEAFATTLGYDCSPRVLDLEIEKPSPIFQEKGPVAKVIRIHTEGEKDYGRMGAGYPSSFVSRSYE